MIPNLIELERKLDVLPDGSFTDEKLDSVFAHIENLAGSDDGEEEDKPKKKGKTAKKSAKKSKKTKTKKNWSVSSDVFKTFVARNKFVNITSSYIII